MTREERAAWLKSEREAAARASIPGQAWKRAEMEDWLKNQSINFSLRRFCKTAEGRAWTREYYRCGGLTERQAAEFGLF